MKYRKLGSTGYEISEVSLGTWQLGGKWGETYDEKTADTILNTAFDAGINFIDTADVYNAGMSEKSIGKFIKSKKDKIYVATKCGRQLNPHVAQGYNRENITGYIEESLTRMEVDALDLVQLHCPPTDVYYRLEAFDTLRELKKQGKIKHFGVSVEKVEEALKAIEFEGVESVQIIFNMFRQRPNELFFEQAKKRNVGILARVPLASGLLSGKFTRDTKFDEKDHRNFNRDGAAFDKGETFSGVDYETGLYAVEKLKGIFGHENLPLYALKWILMHDEVSCVIPGASRAEHIGMNVDASEQPDLTETEMHEVKKVYEAYIKNPVHYLW